MLEQVHDHIVNELAQSTRTDTIFVVTAIIFNLIVLGINSGVSLAASERNAAASNDVILVVFMVMTLLISGVSVTALIFGLRNRKTLLKGLDFLFIFSPHLIDQASDFGHFRTVGGGGHCRDDRHRCNCGAQQGSLHHSLRHLALKSAPPSEAYPDEA